MGTLNINKYVANKIKQYRIQKNLTQEELAENMKVVKQTISKWENGERKINQDILFKLADEFNVSINDFFPPVDNGDFIDIRSNSTKIPILGVIRAGIPVEAQQDIIGYVDIPFEWTKNGNNYYALMIKGDSMYPKYKSNDIVIFLETPDCDSGVDCAVMVNGYDATFKKIIKNKDGILLQPYNADFETKFYSNEDIDRLPVRIIGVAKRHIRDL